MDNQTVRFFNYNWKSFFWGRVKIFLSNDWQNKKTYYLPIIKTHICLCIFVRMGRKPFFGAVSQYFYQINKTFLPIFKSRSFGGTTGFEGGAVLQDIFIEWLTKNNVYYPSIITSHCFAVRYVCVFWAESNVFYQMLGHPNSTFFFLIIIKNRFFWGEEETVFLSFVLPNVGQTKSTFINY